MIEQNHECYVSLEVAKLLKEAGFDWKCNGTFISENGIQYAFIKMDAACDSNNSKYNPYNISAPTLDVVQRWLREVKGIYVESVLCVNRGTSGHSYGFSIAEISADLSMVKTLYPLTYFDEEETKGFKKYELSLEAGIKNALEIILNKK